jgi:hypothetical protein
MNQLNDLTQQLESTVLSYIAALEEETRRRKQQAQAFLDLIRGNKQLEMPVSMAIAGSVASTTTLHPLNGKEPRSNAEFVDEAIDLCEELFDLDSVYRSIQNRYPNKLTKRQVSSGYRKWLLRNTSRYRLFMKGIGNIATVYAKVASKGGSK